MSFYSYTGGIGRTMAIANVAWIMAAAARKVLIVDWSTESPALSSYLEPFLIDDGLSLDADLAAYFERAESEVPTLRRVVRSYYDPADNSVTLRRYGLPHGDGQIDIISGGDPHEEMGNRPGSGTVRADQPAGESALGLLREAMRDSGYDYILIDCPSGPADLCIGCAGRLPDVVAVFFRMGRATIQMAARQADILLRHGERVADLHVIPVPSSVDTHLAERMRANRALVGQEFDSGDHHAVAAPVEIPYVAEYSHGDMLAALTDEPGAGPLLPCYEMLTSKITNGAITEVQPIAAPVRERYHRALAATGVQGAERMYLAYAPVDRRWADWIRYQLESLGVRVDRLPEPQADQAGQGDLRPSAIVVAASESFYGSPAAATLRAWLALRSDEPGRWGAVDVVLARIDTAAPDILFARLPAVDLRHDSDSVSRSRLLLQLGLISGPHDGVTSFDTEPRFPYYWHDRRTGHYQRSIVRLPARNASFVGRESALEELRDRLSLDRTSGVQVLAGAPGTGKSELAKEYAHRFLADYDIVWWIPAEARTSILASLADFARRLDLPPSGDPARTALRAIAAGSATRPCLLIYDNVDDLGEIDTLLPRTASCHVLITTRSREAASYAAIQVESFSTRDSIGFLRTYVPALTEASALMVANIVKDLPLALQLAGAWLRESAARLQDEGSTVLEAESLAWSANEFTRRIQDQLDSPLDLPPDLTDAATAAACVATCLAALSEANLGQVGQRLVEMCSFMASDGIALRLVYSGEMVSRLTKGTGHQGDSVRSDTVLLDQVCWTVSRYGLAELRRENPSILRLHPLTQQLVRLSLSPHEHAVRQSDVLAALAAFAPPDAEEDAPEHDATYEELHRHLAPSGAIESYEPAVRRWVVNEIRYLYRRYHAEMWVAARDLAERMLRGRSGDSSVSDDLEQRLKVQLANIYRAQGWYELAQRLDEQVLHQQRRTLTQTHPRTLMTARSHAGDLRGCGRFDEALAEDLSTVAGFRTVFGPDHAATLMATHNLALSWLLNGDAATALREEREVFERRQKLFGEDARITWRAGCKVGELLRETGRIDESRQILWDADLRLGEIDRDGTDFMAAKKSLGITYRKIGNVTEALKNTGQALALYLATHGADHPDTLSCRLAQASNLFRADQAGAAADGARECLAGYLECFQEDHPFSYACRSDLGLFLREAGDYAAAVTMTGAGLDGLRTRLTPWHPWVIAATINHAASLTSSDDSSGARALDQLAYEESLEGLPSDHPCAVIARHNWQGSLSRAGDGGFSRQVAEIDIPQT